MSSWDIRLLEELRGRIAYFYFALVVLLTILLFALLRLQIVNGEHYQRLSVKNRVRVYRVRPVRGRILDRNGVPLAINKPSFNLYLLADDVGKREWNALKEELRRLLKISPDQLEKRKGDARKSPTVACLIKRNLSEKEVARVAEREWMLPGIILSPEERRYYPHRTLAAHLIGYMGEVSAKELEQGRFWGGDMIGKTGIERQYDDILRGIGGWEQWEVDARMKKVRMVNQSKPIPGKDIRLTIDVRLQNKAEELLKGKVGAIVAMDPRNGEILAMASSPTYDPNLFTASLDPRKWRRLVRNPNHPLQNRAIQGLYSPGSIFKVVVGLAGLQEGVITPRTPEVCKGVYLFKNRKYRCWKRSGHGIVRLHRAIVESCDIYFYKLGEILTVDKMGRYARMLGLGSRTGIDLPHEYKGIVPSRKWKKKRLGMVWFPGEDLIMGIGQGYLLVTPIQIAHLMATVGEMGRSVTPHLLLSPPKRFPQKRLPLKRRYLKVIIKALRGVVEEEHGTAHLARVKGISVAGKTGTVQVVHQKIPHTKMKEIPYKMRDHAWFAAFAPVESPKIAVAAIVEHGGHGGSGAAPLVGKLISYYLKGEESQEDE
jgi:penicillin-binding protein 2